MNLTHKQAVRRVAGWMKVTGSALQCKVIIAELYTPNRETPDIIGFYGAGGSMLVECKVSRADFHADKAKHFRKDGEFGMGEFRYYAAPTGILKPEDMPEGWGLIEICDKVMRVQVKAARQPANKAAEVVMLVSAMRRLQLSTCVYVVQECDETQPKGASDDQSSR